MGVAEDPSVIRRHFRDVPACRVATVRPDGGPHLAVRWFVWLDDALWVATRSGDTTWENASRDHRVAVLIDRGKDWNEMSGARVEGVAELLPAEHPDLREPMSAWYEKYRTYMPGNSFEALSQDIPVLGFLRVAPARIRTWDHRGAAT
jgi:hypothetical protein